MVRKERTRGEIDPRFFKNNFKSKQFKEAVIEPVKNGEVAGMTLMWWETTDKDRLTIRDNGHGMLRDDRERFVGLGKARENALSDGMSYFGSGSIHFAYPLCRIMQVVTAPADEQDVVYCISIEMDDYFARLINKDIFEWDVLPKTSENWPYDHETGTVKVFKQLRPTQRRLKGNRSAELARLLSTVLPPFLAKKQLVDGKKLPPKATIGSGVCDSIPQRGIPNVDVDLFNPKQLTDEDQLRLGSSVVGEVNFEVFLSLLPLKLRERIPQVFLHRRCCGVISWKDFGEFAVDDRKTFTENIGEDPRIPLFITALSKIAEEVADKLQIKQETVRSGGDDFSIAKTLGQYLIDRYGGEVIDDDEVIHTPPVDEDGKPKPPEPGKQLPLYLNTEMSHGNPTRELEIGESITITPVVRDDLVKQGKKAKDVTFDTDDACGSVRVLKDGSIKVKVTAVGTGKVKGWLSRQIHASCTFRVVEKRSIRLNFDSVSLKEGDEIRLRIINPDKLPDKAKIEWKKVHGPGVLEPTKEKRSALFTATTNGPADVEVYVNGKVLEGMTCSITIKKKDDKSILLRIKDRKFKLYVRKLGGVDPIRILFSKKPDKPGDIVINAASPVYQRWKSLNNPEAMKLLLLFAVAQVFIVKRQVQPDRIPDEDIDPLGLGPFLQNKVVNPSFELFEDMMSQEEAKKSKKDSGRSKKTKKSK